MPTKTIRNIQVTGEQSFQITVSGLNPGTKLRAFFDGKVVPAAQLRQVIGRNTTYSPQTLPAAGELITDSNGSIEFIYYYRDNIDKSNFTTEEAYYSFASTSAGVKSFIVADYASTSDTTDVNSIVAGQSIPTALLGAKCYASALITLSYDVSFTTTVVQAPKPGTTAPGTGSTTSPSGSTSTYSPGSSSYNNTYSGTPIPLTSSSGPVQSGYGTTWYTGGPAQAPANQGSEGSYSHNSFNSEGNHPSFQ